LPAGSHVDPSSLSAAFPAAALPLLSGASPAAPTVVDDFYQQATPNQGRVFTEYLRAQCEEYLGTDKPTPVGHLLWLASKARDLAADHVTEQILT
jgi:hypothetical protein